MRSNLVIMRNSADKDALNLRLIYERMVSDISTMAVMVEDMDEFQTKILNMMGEKLDVCRIYIFRFNEANDRLETTHEWVREGITSVRQHSTTTTLNDFFSVFEKVRDNEIINIEDVMAIPSAVAIKYLLEENVKSLLVVPMLVKDILYGAIGFDECRFHRKWCEEDIDILETIAQIMSRVIECQQDKEDLRNHRRRLQAIFRSVNDAIITVDKDMNVIEANPSVLGVCGIDPGDIIGHRITTYPEIRCLQPYVDILIKTLTTNETIKEQQIACNISDKEKQMVVVTSSPLMEDNGTSIGAVLTIRDITKLHRLERELKERSRFHGIVGKSQKMQEVYALIEDLAGLDTTVLVRGASGTGKEMIAKALHHQGQRVLNPFVVVNCSALSENLLESEMFGHVKGSFTGAISDKTGRFQMADGGTIVLDELSDISPKIQLKLLRVIQEKQFEKVGTSKPTKVDVRIIALTNCDLREKVKEGSFREDLYYRLKVVEIILPPLRERLEDIPSLINHFINIFNDRYQKNIKNVRDDVLRLFMQYPWPGNIRELEHAIEHAYVLCHDDTIRRDHIPMEIQEYISVRKAANKNTMEDEREQIIETLKVTDWNKAKTARLLGIDRSTLYRKIDKFKLLDMG